MIARGKGSHDDEDPHSRSAGGPGHGVFGRRARSAMAKPSRSDDRAVRGRRLHGCRGAARRATSYSEALGQQVVVENKTGANGNLGKEFAAKSAPDGYTILVVPELIVSNAHVYKVNYDPLRDFTPVIQISRQPIVLAAHPSLGVKSIAELVALAKKEPGIRFGTGSGAGSQQHMVTMWFARIAGIELVQVSYRGGGQAINDLIAGHVKLGTLGSTPLVPHYKSGALAVARADDGHPITGAAGMFPHSSKPASRGSSPTNGSASLSRRARRRRSWRGSIRRSARRWPIRRSRRTWRIPPRSRSAAALMLSLGWCATILRSSKSS